MRAFIGVWPSARVVDAVAAIDRPDVAGLRWTTPDQWHVTLRFCGRVRDDDLPGLVAALEAAVADVGPVDARLGPNTDRFGRVLHVPVDGLGSLADRVRATTAGFGDAADNAADSVEPFRAHLTVARAKRTIPDRLVGVPVGPVTSPVAEVAVVSSTTTPDGARYRTEATVRLRP